MFNDDEVMYLVMDSSSFGRRGEVPSKGMITVPMPTKHSKPSRLLKKVVPNSLFSSDCQSLTKFYHYFGDFFTAPIKQPRVLFIQLWTSVAAQPPRSLLQKRWWLQSKSLHQDLWFVLGSWHVSTRFSLGIPLQNSPFNRTAQFPTLINQHGHLKWFSWKG